MQKSTQIVAGLPAPNVAFSILNIRSVVIKMELIMYFLSSNKENGYLEYLYIVGCGGILTPGSMYGREPHNHSRLLSLVATLWEFEL